MPRFRTRCGNTCSATTAKSPDRSTPIFSIASPKAPSRPRRGPATCWSPASRSVRRERGPFASDDDLLLAAFYSATRIRGAQGRRTDQDRLSARRHAARHPAQGSRAATGHSLVPFRSSGPRNPACMTHTRHHHRRHHRRRSAQGRHAGGAGHADASRSNPPTRHSRPAPRSRISMSAIRTRARAPIRNCSRRCRTAWSSIARA